MTEELIIKNEDETRTFGNALGKNAKRGDVFALIGDLGTGKTALTKYIAEGLGIAEQISSPTFTIIKEYKSGRLPLYHFDVYRLESCEDLEDLGYEEYFFGDGVCVVEWADLVEELIPQEATVIRIEYGAEPQERKYSITKGK